MCVIGDRVSRPRETCVSRARWSSSWVEDEFVLVISAITALFLSTTPAVSVAVSLRGSPRALLGAGVHRTWYRLGKISGLIPYHTQHRFILFRHSPSTLLMIMSLASSPRRSMISTRQATRMRVASNDAHYSSATPSKQTYHHNSASHLCRLKLNVHTSRALSSPASIAHDAHSIGEPSRAHLGHACGDGCCANSG